MRKALLYSCIISSATLLVLAVLLRKKKRKTKKLEEKSGHLTDEQLLKQHRLTLFSRFTEEHGYYRLEKESSGKYKGIWILDFPNHNSPTRVYISEGVFHKEMESYSKTHSYKHMKERNVDVENDELIQKGIVSALLYDKDEVVVKRIDGRYYLERRNRQDELMWRKYIETGEIITESKPRADIWDVYAPPDDYYIPF